MIAGLASSARGAESAPVNGFLTSNTVFISLLELTVALVQHSAASEMM